MCELVRSTKATPAKRLDESRVILQGIVAHLRQNYSRLWMFWNGGMEVLLASTIEYSQMSAEDEASLIAQWVALVEKSRLKWKSNAGAEIVEATPMDEGELAEQNLANLEADGEEDVFDGFEDQDSGAGFDGSDGNVDVD